MKIRNKIIVLFTVILVVVIGLGTFATAYVSNHYIHYKYDAAYANYYKQEMTTSEFSEYLINEGFIVTEQEIPEYKTAANISCHIEDDQIVVYENDKPVLYAVLNENIVTDLNRLLIYAALFINVIIIMTLVIIYVYFNKSILFKLNKLENEMVNFKSVDSYPVNNNSTENEIDLLTNEFYKMANTIKVEDKQKKFLIMTLSHELKNPISNIEAVIDMNRLEVKPYNDNQKQNELVEIQVEKMKTIVSDLLNAYTYEINQEPQLVDIKSAIREVVSSQALATSNLIFVYNQDSDYNLQVNHKVFEHIVSNIVSNIYKYAQDDSQVTITITDSEIKFENVRSKEPRDKSTEIRILLNQYLCHEIGLETEVEEKSETYTTYIKYKSN
ncbi:HAMP domain-containing sensor histidine kinase [Mollicutes bacterium LVI A0078]|nr:HAMP domain-containing sensor histidine kinase [Mollicutes bacterium LVI A0075]WOO90430.1 HAMP domain-containing sensor histidine kinase [Mollicutes bacterium LVI A0078]